MNLEPTESHVLWGGAVAVECYGTRHGNWSLGGKTEDEAWDKNRPVMERMRYLGHDIFAPRPTEFNGRIATMKEMTGERWLESLYRGAFADGVLLDAPHRIFAVSSADCPTLILRDAKSGAVVAAHAGRDSLLREGDDLVLQAVATLKKCGAKVEQLQAFIACGVSGEHFRHDPNDPQRGERNRALHRLACRYPGAAYPADIYGCIHLAAVIAGQLTFEGVSQSRIGFDGSCTFSDVDQYGRALWHSNRRGDKSRNLVVVRRHR